MGKGTIISGGTNGLYQVQVNYNRARYDAQLARFATLRAALVLAEAAEPDVQKKALITLQIMSVDKAADFLTVAMPADTTVPAWCADLTEDLSGIVGTLEIPGEPTHIQIQPGYNGNAAYNGTRDGQVMPTVSMNASQAYYNLAMLPGWQKWMPLSRYATITGISGDTASVVLDTGTSSQQDLDINQNTTLSGAPIDYMDCDGAAFEIGDEVLIVFTGQDWSVPRIVGFKDSPKPCGDLILIKFRVLSGAWYAIVYSAMTQSYATGVTLNSGGAATFPILESEITDWIASKDDTTVSMYLYRQRITPDYPDCSDLNDCVEDPPLTFYCNDTVNANNCERWRTIPTFCSPQPCVREETDVNSKNYNYEWSYNKYVHRVTGDYVFIGTTLLELKEYLRQIQQWVGGERPIIETNDIDVTLESFVPFGSSPSLIKSGGVKYEWPYGDPEPEYFWSGNYFDTYDFHNTIEASYGEHSVCQIIKVSRSITEKEYINDVLTETGVFTDYVISGAAEYLDDPLDYDTENPTEDEVLTGKLGDLAAAAGFTSSIDLLNLETAIRILQ